MRCFIHRTLLPSDVILLPTDRYPHSYSSVTSSQSKRRGKKPRCLIKCVPSKVVHRHLSKHKNRKKRFNDKPHVVCLVRPETPVRMETRRALNKYLKERVVVPMLRNPYTYVFSFIPLVFY